MPVQGGKPKRIAFLSCGTDRNPWGCAAYGLILSGNREYAATSTTSDPSDPHSSYGIGLVRLQPGKRPVVLASTLTAEENSAEVIDRALAFSPDGTQLVFSRSSWDGWNAGQPAVLAISLAGGGSVPLAQSGIAGASLVPNDAAQVQWSPDGNWVAYVEPDSAGTLQKLEVVPTMGAPSATTKRFSGPNRAGLPTDRASSSSRSDRSAASTSLDHPPGRKPPHTNRLATRVGSPRLRASFLNPRPAPLHAKAQLRVITRPEALGQDADAGRD